MQPLYASCLKCGGHVFFSFHRAYHLQRMVDIDHCPEISNYVDRVVGIHMDTPQPKGPPMGFKSFLSAVGNDAKSVFSWVASSKGQATITSIEGTSVLIAGAINPVFGVGLAGIEGPINPGLKHVISIETLAAAAAQQSCTGGQKLGALITAISPNVASLLQSLGVSNPTAAQWQNR